MSTKSWAVQRTPASANSANTADDDPPDLSPPSTDPRPRGSAGGSAGRSAGGKARFKYESLMRVSFAPLATLRGADGAAPPRRLVLEGPRWGDAPPLTFSSAFRHVVASGNVDQLSGLEMLKRWQALYGQAQHEGANTRNRQPPRFEPQKSAAAPQRINSTDCAGLPPGVSHTETLMQNIKISQLNQISAVLDQQTAKLIAHTQKLMKNNYPLETGPASDLSKVQQEAAVSLQ